MVERLIKEAAEAMDGTLIHPQAGLGEGAEQFCGAAIDSRQVKGGELFFALAGEHTDGHRFTPKALAAGAAAAVIQQDPPATAAGPWIRVQDTYRALHALTRAVRRDFPEGLVAITGSAGKTTTKELLAAMLARRFRVGRSLGNLNNLYGFPLSLLNIADDCQWMVAEMGMSIPGELGEISRLGRPDMAVFTNVRPVHLENFADLEGIANAKAELLEGLAPGGTVIANADDPWVRRIAERHQGPVVFYGLGDGDGVRARDIHPLGKVPGSAFTLSVGSESVAVELALHGSYNVENCLAAAAAAHRLGVPLAEIAIAAAEIQAAPMRGRVHRLPGEILLVDDAYNSNPDAAMKALDSTETLSGKRHVAVLGDMLELGDDASDFHAQVGAKAAALGYDFLFGVGKLSTEMVRAAHAAGLDGECFPDAAAAAAGVRQRLQPGDVWLVKGSRGVGLEIVVAQIQEAAASLGCGEVS
jgi:UDP-N-acetylmuramoyl-tripeptide--D-alanyl-D-alanine ligase